jgi:hypothetical protein
MKDTPGIDYPATLTLSSKKAAETTFFSETFCASAFSNVYKKNLEGK